MSQLNHYNYYPGGICARQFQCASQNCRRAILPSIMRGTVPIYGYHSMTMKHGNATPFSLLGSPIDAITVACPFCGTFHVQCCHYDCGFQTFKKELNRQQQNDLTMLQPLRCRYYKLHYRRYHSHISSDSLLNSDASVEPSNEQTDERYDNDNDDDVGMIDAGIDDEQTSESNDLGGVVMDEYMQTKHAFENKIRHIFQNNERSREFFLRDMGSWGRSGTQCIARRALEGTALNDLANEQETTSLILLTDVMNSLTQKKRDALMRYIAGLLEMLDPYLIPGKVLPIIPTMETYRSIVIGHETKSFYAQIPRENVLLVDDHHVRLSLNELISTLMAIGAEFTFLVGEDGNRNKSGINGTPAAEALLKRLRAKVYKNGGDPDNTLYGVMIFWSDGFLTSAVKQKFNSAWTMTVTICPFEGVKNSCNTHTIALGLSRYDHTNVLSSIFRELGQIENGVIRLLTEGGKHRFANTSFGVIVYAGDKPERSSIMWTLAHSGNTSKRSLHAANFNADFVPSCEQCFHKMIRCLLNKDDNEKDDGKPLGVCEKCCNWNYFDNKGWELAWPVPENFPTKPLDEGFMQAVEIGYPEDRDIPFKKHIKPVRQTFSWLIAGVKVAIAALAIKWWKKSEVDAYLSTFAVGEKTVINRAKAYADKLYNEIVKPLRTQPLRLLATHLKPKLTTEELINNGVFPPLWAIDSIGVSQFVELPMHQLFLGTVKTIYDVMDDFIKNNKAGESFAAFINPYLADIRCFGLSWCPIREIPRGGWVSEHYIAFARLTPWIYGMYFKHFQSNSNSAGMASAMRMVNAMDVLIAELMTADHTSDSNYLETIIKVFLNTCVDFSTHLEKKKRKPRRNQTAPERAADPFFVKGNFLSLLNLPKQIQIFGSLLHIWDGNLEKGIQTLKPELKIMRKTGTFLRTKLEKVRTDEHFDTIKKRWYDAVGIERNEEDERDWYKGMFWHSTAEEIKERLENGRPISVLCFQKCFFIPVGKKRDGDNFNVLRFEFDASTTDKQLGGLNYSKINVFMEPSLLPQNCLHQQVDREYGLLLPYIESDEFGGLWTIITDERKGLIRTQKDLITIGRKGICPNLFINCLPPRGMQQNIVGRALAMVYKFTEHDKDGKQIGEGICHYSGKITAWCEQRDNYTIIWDGTDATEATTEELDIECYGTFKEGGWILAN